MAQLTIQAADENLETVQAFIREHIAHLHAPDSLLLQLDLAAEEIFVNIAHYAYAPQSGEAHITCTLTQTDAKAFVLTIVFSDGGKAFNPLERADPNPATPLEERGIGGWGIYLTKKYMDSVHYAYTDKKNVLTLTKTIA